MAALYLVYPSPSSSKHVDLARKLDLSFKKLHNLLKTLNRDGMHRSASLTHRQTESILLPV